MRDGRWRGQFATGAATPAGFHDRVADCPDCPVCLAEIGKETLLAMAHGVAQPAEHYRAALDALDAIRFRSRQLCQRHALLAGAPINPAATRKVG